MLTSVIVAAIASVPLWSAPIPHAQPAPVAGAADQSAELDRSALSAATDVARSRVRSGERRRARTKARKSALARQYEAELAAIDKLKRRRASWRRDRLIKTKLAQSHATANRLGAVDAELRADDARLRRRRRALIRAIDRELAARPSRSRRADLVQWRRATERVLSRVKKIVLPDGDIDPLADPEELDYQASLIAQSEARLETELASLARQEARFRRMAALRKKRARAAELGRFDDNQRRRGSARSGQRGDPEGDSAAGAEDPSPPAEPAPDGPPGDPDPGGEPPMFEGDPVLVLSEVVDERTLDELRRAEQSADPAVKARLDRLRTQRTRIERRARRLRR